MPKMNPNRPYGQIFTSHQNDPRAFEQEGRFFDAGGYELDEKWKRLPDPDFEDDEHTLREADLPSHTPSAAVPARDEGARTAPDTGPERLEDLHWATLRKMVEEAGGTWENKPQGIAFLRSLE